MRLLLCIDTFGLIGGSERYGLAAAEGLAARGHDVQVLCGERGDEGSDLTVHVEPAYSDARAEAGALARLGQRVRALDAQAALVLSARSPRAFAVLLAQPRLPLLRCIQDHTPFCPGLDKMHADGTACAQPMGLPCLQRHVLGGGCIGFRREHHPRAPLLGAVGGLWKHMRAFALAQRADRLAVFSRYMQDELRAAGVPGEKIALLRYFTRSAQPGDGAATLPPATQAFLERGGAPLLLTPARLALPDKGVDHLLTALAKLRAPFRAVIAGSGPAEAWLRQKAREEGLAERVHFSGWLASAALERVYAAADLVVVPSVWNEPFGLVGLEAMAHAKAVVAFGVGGIPEWLEDGVTGLLAPRGDCEALAAAIERLLADAGARATLGRAGKARIAADFAADVQLGALERLLAEVEGAR